MIKIQSIKAVTAVTVEYRYSIDILHQIGLEFDCYLNLEHSV